MILKEGDMQIDTGPGFRQQAVDYALARFREREKSRRSLMWTSVLLFFAAQIPLVFAPEERHDFATLTSSVVMIFALGAIGAQRWIVKCGPVQIEVKDGETAQ